MLRPLVFLSILLSASALACGDSGNEIIAPDPAGPPATLRVIDGDEQRGFTGQVLAEPIVVQVLDSTGRAVPDQPVSFLVAAGDGTLSADTVRSDASGRAMVQWTLGPNPGATQTVHVRVPIGAEATSFLFTTVSALAEAAPTNLRFQSVHAGGLHSCGLTPEGAAYCWGLLADDGTIAVVPTAVPGGLTFTQLATGDFHTCGLTPTGAAYCWGNNREGELGNGTRDASRHPVAVNGGLAFQQIAAGYNHTCALTLEGMAYCWGGNDILDLDGGQLGDGTITDRLVPTRVRGELTFTTLTLGAGFSCGLDEEEAAYCWGRVGNRTGTTLEPTAVGGGLTFTALSAGTGHVCGLVADGRAYCWGDNFSDELGAGILDDASRTPLSVTGDFRFAAIGAGGYHTCGLTLDGALACWGWDDQTDPSETFNNGVSIHSTTPVLVPGEHLFVSLSEGLLHGCGLTADQTAYCWFENGNGELGNGTQVGSYEPVPVR